MPSSRHVSFVRCTRQFDLRFADQKVEAEYARDIGARCLKTHFWIALSGAIFNTFACMLLQVQYDPIQSEWKSTKVAFFINALFVVLSVLLMVLCKWRRLQPLGEHLSIASLCLMQLLTVLSNRFRMSSMLDEDPGIVWEMEHFDSVLYLTQTMICTFCFLLYPVRTYISWVLPVFTTVAFVLITFLSGGGPEGSLYDCWGSTILMMLTVSSWAGRRMIEALNRDLWLKLRVQQAETLHRVTLLRAFSDTTVVLTGMPPVKVAESNTTFDEVFRTPMYGVDFGTHVLSKDAERFHAFISQVSNGPDGTPHKLLVEFTDAEGAIFDAEIAAAKVGMKQLVVAISQIGSKRQADANAAIEETEARMPSFQSNSASQVPDSAFEDRNDQSMNPDVSRLEEFVVQVWQGRDETPHKRYLSFVDNHGRRFHTEISGVRIGEEEIAIAVKQAGPKLRSTDQNEEMKAFIDQIDLVETLPVASERIDGDANHLSNTPLVVQSTTHPTEKKSLHPDNMSSKALQELTIFASMAQLYRVSKSSGLLELVQIGMVEAGDRVMGLDTQPPTGAAPRPCLVDILQVGKASAPQNPLRLELELEEGVFQLVCMRETGLLHKGKGTGMATKVRAVTDVPLGEAVFGASPSAQGKKSTAVTSWEAKELQLVCKSHFDAPPRFFGDQAVDLDGKSLSSRQVKIQHPERFLLLLKLIPVSGNPSSCSTNAAQQSESTLVACCTQFAPVDGRRTSSASSSSSSCSIASSGSRKRPSWSVNLESVPEDFVPEDLERGSL